MTLPGWNGAMSVQRTAEALSIPVGGLVPGDAGGEREDFGQLGLALGDGGANDVLRVGRDGADAVADGEVLQAPRRGHRLRRPWSSP